ncbi:GNAT family N-acetyltransferase [Urbifossiella limnaea]|uniref:CHAT domain protein n=1 Tax=Urbifossiella limnaea TaxID=2528023 RepID=A0A517Y297_9BACT|nr:GNAT family N-acetyltransferase [Urbifossiella limnaea]QDU23877.1 CHAT domain protein [Urbifossiella limnaea]
MENDRADYQFDVFLSHNSKNKAEVRELADRLESRGLKVWLDERELIPGKPILDALEAIIRSTRTAVAVIGADGLGPWQVPELRLCLQQFINHQLTVIPLLLPGCAKQPALPLFLGTVLWVDLRGGLTEEGLDQLEWGITGKKQTPAPPPPPAGRSYLDFVLQVRPADDGRDYTVRALTPGGDGTGRMRLPFSDGALDRHLLELQNAVLRSDGARRGAVARVETPAKELGAGLYEALLGGAVGERYEQVRRDAVRQGAGVRLRLDLESAELSRLPWEFLYNRATDQFLCTRNTTLVRYLDTGQPVTPAAVACPLRILAVVACPRDLPPIDVAAEKACMEVALKRLTDRRAVALTWLDAATYESLEATLQSGSWHVLHFIGHGRYDAAADEGLLFFDDGAGGIDERSAQQLALLLGDSRALRLVTLCSCETAAGGPTGRPGGTAATLVREGVAAVVAMQYEISDKAAVKFSERFYQALADGLPVDAAVLQGRRAVAMSVRNSVEWGTPVLYTQCADGVLFGITPQAAVAPLPVAPPPRLVVASPPAPPAAAPVPQPERSQAPPLIDVAPPPRPVEPAPQPLPPPVAAPVSSPPVEPGYWKTPELRVLVMLACADESLGRELAQYARRYDPALPVFHKHEDEPDYHLFATNQSFLVEWRSVPAAALPAEVDRFFLQGDTRLLVVVSDTLAAPAGAGRYEPTAAAADLRARLLPRTNYYGGLIALVPGTASRTPDLDRTLDARAVDRDVLRDAVATVADGLRLKAPPGPPREFLAGDSVVVKAASTRAELRACLRLRHLIYDRMGYLNDHVSGCPARLELDRFDGFDTAGRRGTLHLVAQLRHGGVDQEVVGAARLAFARHIPEEDRPTLLGPDPTAALVRQSRLIREILDDLRATGDEKSADVLAAQMAKKGFGTLPILQSTDFEANNRTILQDAGDMAELSRVVVAPQFRGCGLSRLLVRAAVAVAMDLRKKMLLLECVPGHVPMYQKFGFEAIEGCHTRAQDLDQKAVAMMIRPQKGRLDAVVKQDLKMLALGPASALAAPYLCLCDNLTCWSTGRYESRTKQTCPLCPPAAPAPARPAAV